MDIDEKEYKELGFNDYFINCLKEHNQDHVLGFRCEPPYYVYHSPLINRNVFPLWQCGTTTIYYNRTSQFFEVCNIEDIDDVWESYSSIQGIFAYLLIQLWEDEEPRQEIYKTAESIGFKYASQLLQEVETVEDYGAWIRSFPMQCS